MAPSLSNAKKEKIIQAYFNMWVQRNFAGLENVFSPNIYYSECYGPEYQGLDEIFRWIREMTAEQQVLEWTIKRFIHQGSVAVVEWLFRDQMNDKVQGFDGVSIIEFGDNEKIISVQEFQSKMEHVTPYRQA